MSLRDLSDPDAVRQAIAEFDALGRAVFLARYGFGPALRYFLIHEGRRYDSKAIAGVAYGHQFPGRGALRADDFSGGEITARRKLEALGFTMEEAEGDPRPPSSPSEGYWVFVCNPKAWAIDRFLAAGIERDTWGIRPSDRTCFAPGQLAIVRVGVDRRNAAKLEGRPRLEPGIYAVCEVTSASDPGLGANDGFWAADKARAPGWSTVDIRCL